MNAAAAIQPISRARFNLSGAETQSTSALEAQITELAGHLNAANHRLLTLIAEFDRRKGWADSPRSPVLTG